MKTSCKAQPNRPEPRLELGLAYLRAVQLDDAIEHLAAACRAKPDCLPARLALASAYDEKGQTAQALEHLKIANQTHMGEVTVLFSIGFCYEKLNQPDKAAAYYRDAVEQNPSFLASRERLAAVAVLTGDVDEAIEQYEALRDAEPQELAYRSALAHLYYRAARRGDRGV